MELDTLDKIGAKAFEGYLVRKDLVRTFSKQYPVPTYVVEFLLGRYCASTDPKEIEEGLEIVERQLSNRAVRAGEEELFKSHARDEGSVKIIDIITARLDAKTDSYLATLPSLQLKDVRISDSLVRENERMLTGGFYAEVDLHYDGAIAQEKGGRPFGIESLPGYTAFKARCLGSPGSWARNVHHGRVETLFAAEHGPGTTPSQRTHSKRDALAHGTLCGAQL